MKIVVLAKNYLTALGVIRSLGCAGYQTDLIYIGNGSKGAIAAASKYVNEVIYFKDRDDSAIVEELQKQYKDQENNAILITTDDYTTMLIDKNRDKLSAFFMMPYVKSKADFGIVSLMDKSLQEELASQCGFQVAKSWIISLDTLIQIPDEVSYPCFCKPLSSAEGFKSEIGMCQTKEDLTYKLKKLQDKKKKRSVLVQEYLNVTQEYSIGGVVLGEEVIIPYVIEKKRVAKHNIGVTLVGQMRSWDIIAAMKEKVESLLLKTKYQGLFDLEILCSGDLFYFGELNFRNSSFLGAITTCGCNLPVAWINFLCYGKINLCQDYSDYTDSFQYNNTFLNDKVCWEDYIFGFISRNQMNNFYKSVDFSLLHSDVDPEPEKIFREIIGNESKQRTKNVVKRKIRNFLKLQ